MFLIIRIWCAWRSWWTILYPNSTKFFELDSDTISINGNWQICGFLWIIPRRSKETVNMLIAFGNHKKGDLSWWKSSSSFGSDQPQELRWSSGFERIQTVSAGLNLLCLLLITCCCHFWIFARLSLSPWNLPHALLGCPRQFVIECFILTSPAQAGCCFGVCLFSCFG